jgi:asparagine synthase (glutamine-hydrolysing)
MTHKNRIRDVASRLSRRAHRKQVARWLARRPETSKLIEAVRTEKLTYLSRPALQDLAWATAKLEASGLEGEIVEAGTALGGSAVVLASCKRPERRLRLFDTFGMIPKPGARDGADVHERYKAIVAGESTGIEGDTYYGYREDLIGSVRGSLEALGLDLERDVIQLVQGLFHDTLYMDGPVALAHIDADWYDSVDVCLRRIHPAMVTGGRFVIDDYGSWSGARDAVDDFLAGAEGRKYRCEWRSRLHLLRVRP